jgi:hypothetical protein
MVLRGLTMSGSPLSSTRDVAGAPRRALDHGEEYDFVFLIFMRRGMVGWSLVGWLLRGLGYWAAAS